MEPSSAPSTAESLPASAQAEAARWFMQPGTSIDGKYVVEAVIAEGGVGVVVRATHVGLGQRVAIKFLKAEALRNRAWVERFDHEARLAAQIQSEHIVRVQDVGRMPGAGPYMVMEYLVGRDLGSLLEAGPLPVETAVDYVLQACDAIAEAHVLGIVHRDLKPANLFLAQRPTNAPILKVLDFGISKRTPRAGMAMGRQTGEQERFGTPMYMSPEQLDSPAGVDARADIWSLGIVLHELIAGTTPFRAPDLPELFARILGRDPEGLRQVQPDAPVGLEAIILKCLAKRRDQRFRNVAELAQELAPYGGPLASSRVDRIRQVVRSGGFSILPARPRDLATAVPEPDTTAQVHVTDPPQLPMRSKRPLAGFAVAVLAGVLALGAAALVRSSGAPPTPLRETAASGAAARAPAAAPSAGPSALEPVRLAPPPDEAMATLPPSPPSPSGSSVSTDAAAAAAPKVRAFPVAPARAALAPKAPSAMPALAPTPVTPSSAAAANEGESRRSLFGDRK